jgi:hypothetical protein
MQRVSQPAQYSDARVSPASFDGTEVPWIDLCGERELLNRQLS